MFRTWSFLLLVFLLYLDLAGAADPKLPGLKPLPEGEFPPGWLPLDQLDDKPVWQEHRRTIDHIQLYLPPDTKAVRGVFVCYVFSSGDPRELARLWNFALVTIPTPFEYDLGFFDRRNQRPVKTGLTVGNMGVLLNYLNAAAKDLKRPELATIPIVGWMGQNGETLCADLYARAPERVLAWADAWSWSKHPDMVTQVPVVSAWEFTKDDEKKRLAVRESKLPMLTTESTPPKQLSCKASTYGFPHGIYSKYNFFVAYMDRCILARLPAPMPEPGQPVKLKPLDLTKGWAGDFNEIGHWAAIATVPEAKGMVEPVWLPDAYAAWMWRSYHSANPDVILTGPVLEYHRGKEGKFGGPDCGLGYGRTLKAGAELTFTASITGAYSKIEFHDGDRIVGTAEQSPWKAEGVKLAPGLHALFAVGVTAEGNRSASHPAFAIVE